ncbi:MAG: UTP--glucose-1-phosphate uridylyltransferase [Deltaproteobacteria bacterium]|nr:UTP--glucose-1-phosphate uridylyltransferase [Deltaproteobacteria bacterium]
MPDFAPFELKMRAAGQPELAIVNFREAWEGLVHGATGLVPESSIVPVPGLPDLADLDGFIIQGEQELPHTVIIKLNGGLGTSMGMERAKSLLPVKEGRTFLDLIVEQVLSVRQTHHVPMPLVLMDSFRTQADCQAALAGNIALMAGQSDLPTTFLQHQVPKVRARDLAPAEHADDELTWCPPGHGDLYLSIATSGLLDRLLARGFRWAFVSNADNLGAVPDLALLGWMAATGKAFVMECCDRTPADKKGGHLALRAGPAGGYLLREVAQCPPEHLAYFQDIKRHRYFNTNNLWVDLRAVRALLDARGGRLGLPVIKNVKPLDPASPSGPEHPDNEPVIQLETAMGAAIERFADLGDYGVGAVRVGRHRFAPVKTTNDLLVLWSDVFVRDDDGRVEVIPERRGDLPLVELDPAFFKTIDDFQSRFPAGAPSLVKCKRLVVRGDVRFESDVRVVGDVVIEHTGPGQRVVARGSVVEG